MASSLGRGVIEASYIFTEETTAMMEERFFERAYLQKRSPSEFCAEGIPRFNQCCFQVNGGEHAEELGSQQGVEPRGEILCTPVSPSPTLSLQNNRERAGR